jgi:hypothetical protein
VFSAGGSDNPDMAPRKSDEEKRLALFGKKMKPVTIIGERATSINSAFAAALAQVSKFDVEMINEALEKLGQGDQAKPLTCVYCGDRATDGDHLVGLVMDKRYSGHGQVIGNLVPACNPCNRSKGNKPWREWARERRPEAVPEERIRRIEEYEALAPPPVSEEQLKEFYPDLMEAYERLRNLCHGMMRAADNLANEIQRLEKKRLEGDGLGQIAGPDEVG